jgi:thiol:disulfide interchange protein DsbD
MRRAQSFLVCGFLVAALWAPMARAQEGMGAAKIPAAAELIQVKTGEVEVRPGGRASARVSIVVAKGWHVNANPPALDYMIPTEVSVAASGGLSAGRSVYPKAKKAKLAFEDTELSVYDGEAVIEVPIAAAATTLKGAHTLAGKIHFQACNDQVCLAPATVGFQIPVRVTGDAAATGDTTAPGGTGLGAAPGPDSGLGFAPSTGGFSTGPPPGGTTSTAGRLKDALASGGLAWFLALFVGGLLLNLTPCVFPMLGVTVSVFGARRQEPLPKVVVAAVLYVLGIAVMYSSLGVAAALTGSLFGAVLQNAWVNVALGTLMLALSLSMFGLYELQPPAWLLARLGGATTTSGVGLFLSGLAVGIIAAPCIGPFVVAVLALIAQRGEALFGFQTMFALALGLGFPYLFLATFSNLLQLLPRSGDWMTWVKKVFGVILAGVGLFYVMIGFMPDWASWVLPGALVLGGLYLGFGDHGASGGPLFRRLRMTAGAVAVLVGIVIVISTPKQGVTFQPFTEEALAGALKEGRTVMIDFTAEWCPPCHELERFTFTDDRVRSLAKSFRTYRADLTRYNSPEVEGLRKRYGLSGVPTLVFIAPDGREIVEARVESFIPPGPLLERMRYVGEQTGALTAR